MPLRFACQRLTVGLVGSGVGYGPRRPRAWHTLLR